MKYFACDSGESFTHQQRSMDMFKHELPLYQHIKYLLLHSAKGPLFCAFALFSWSSSAQHTVIEGQTHHSLLMAAVFPLDLSGLYTPQTSQVVG